MSHQQNALEFETEMKKRLSELYFDVSLFPETLHTRLNVLLNHDSPSKIGCSIGQMKKLDDYANGRIKEIDYHLAGILINYMMTKSPAELCIEKYGYFEFMEQLESAADAWNKVVEPIKTSIFRRLSTMNNLKNGTRKVPFGKA